MPRTRAEAEALIQSMRGELMSDARTREVARLVLAQPAPSLAMKPFQTMIFAAAVDLLPAWAREMHGLSAPGLAKPLVRTGTAGMASAFRWAFN